MVLYVGSQEKYHDQIGWDLFLQQRKRRAFAFVLNKWDRCLHAGGRGLRPDEDLLRDLKAEGFQNAAAVPHLRPALGGRDAGSGNGRPRDRRCRRASSSPT